MKKYNFIKVIFTILVLFVSAAEADQKFPASDFKPTVVYQDSEYIAKSGQSHADAAASPAASQPVDSKYPAANFQPKVVYNDPEYKHSQATSSTAATGQDSNSAVSASNEADSAGGQGGDSTSNYLMGLVVFAVMGFVLFKRRPEQKSSAGSRVYAKDASGLTGVARYLNQKSGTGVARYLEKQVKSASASAATGVAKYMARQGSATDNSTKPAKTGVEKYMRNRG